MTKTLGQVAYEALDMASWPGGEEWEHCSPGTHEAWQAAAEAVMRHVLEPASKTPDDLLDRYVARNAVIEAAKALAERQLTIPGDMMTGPESALVDALSALQEAEDEVS